MYKFQFIGGIVLTVIGVLATLTLSPFFLIVALFGALHIWAGKTNLKAQERQKQYKRSRVNYIEYTVYPVDQVNADKFFNFYKQDLDENDVYDWSNKELLEDSYEDKVYRYAPFKLDYKIEDGNVYAEMDGEYVLTGRLKKTDLDRIDDGNYFLYPNIYKKINDESVVKGSGDHYFGFYIKKEADN